MSSLYKRPAPFIGCGTGRCGSHTLQKIIDACKNVNCQHETLQIPWYDSDGSWQLGELCKRFREDSRDGIISAEIGPALIQSIAPLRADFPDLKVIVMHREREAVIRSFCEYGQNMPPLRPIEKHRWAENCLGKNYPDADIPKCFPTIDAASRQQSISFYWHMYEELSLMVRKPVLHVHTESLNDRKTIEGIFDFLEIPTCDRIFIEVEKFWSIAEARKKVESDPRRLPRG